MSAPNPYFLKLTESETLRFLELYQQEEILWNTHLELYRSRPERLMAAQRISKELNVRGFSAEYVFIKFKNLRSSYCQELKKIAESISSGADEIYRPKVFWFHMMNSFLRPFVQSRAAQSNLYLDSTDISPYDYQDECGAKQILDQSNDQISSHSASNDEPVQFLPSWESATTTPEVSHEKRPQRSPSPASFGSMPGYLKRAKHNEMVKSDCNNYVITDLSNSKSPTVDVKSDSFECFGKYIASLLRNMPIQKAYKLQLEIATKILQEQIEGSDTSRIECGIEEDGGLVINGAVKAELEDSQYVDLTTEINYENY